MSCSAASKIPSLFPLTIQNVLYINTHLKETSRDVRQGSTHLPRDLIKGWWIAIQQYQSYHDDWQVSLGICDHGFQYNCEMM